MTGQIPDYIKYNDDIANKRFIPDGMNEFERNVKRVFDFLTAIVCIIIFSPVFLICYFLVKREAVSYTHLLYS